MTIETHELDITDGLNKTLYDKLKAENEKLKKKLDIAVKALKEYANKDFWGDSIGECTIVYNCCFCEEGYKDAEEALKQIKELDK